MTSALTIYDFYLSADDLQDKPHKVKIQTVEVKDVYSEKDKKYHKKIVLHFEKRLKLMALNKTQVEQLIDITGTDQYEQWVNWEIGIRPMKFNRASNTIEIFTQAQAPKPTAKPTKPDDIPALLCPNE
jgi:hypothetical protein